MIHLEPSDRRIIAFFPEAASLFQFISALSKWAILVSDTNGALLDVYALARFTISSVRSGIDLTIDCRCFLRLGRTKLVSRTLRTPVGGAGSLSRDASSERKDW